MKNTINLLDVVALTENIPKLGLLRGEVGAVVECHSENAFEVEFVAQGWIYLCACGIEGRAAYPIARETKPHRQRTDTSRIVISFSWRFFCSYQNTLN